MKFGIKLCLAAAFVAAILAFGSAAGRADKLTEANMTKSDYDEITKTESSVPGERPTEPPLEVHDLNDAAQQAVKDQAHGTKLIRGREWKSLSPQDRDKRIRELKKVLAANNLLIIEVPSGNVWSLDRETYYRLKRDNTVHRWDYDEVEKLPKTVKRDPASSHSDRSGTTLERVLTRVEEP